MTYLNRVAIIGTVSRAPTTRATTGNNVTNLSLKLTKQYEKDGAAKERTVYVDVKGWGRVSDALAKLAEGDLVLVDGEINTESWEKDGEKKWKTLVEASSVSTFAAGDSPAEAPAARKADGKWKSRPTQHTLPPQTSSEFKGADADDLSLPF